MELMLVVHHDDEGELEIAVTGPGARDDRGARHARRSRCWRPVPSPIARRRARPTRRRAARRPLRRRPRRVPRRAPLRRRQHVDARAGVEELLPGLRRIARDDAAGALAHAVDELGPGRRPARSGPTWPTASRTTPTSPSTASGRTPRTTPRTPLGDRADARDGAARDRDPARRREPRPPPGALRERRQHGAPRRAARGATTRTASSTRGWGGCERAARRDARPAAYLDRPLSPPAPGVLEAIDERADRPRATRSTAPTSTGCSIPRRCLPRPAGARCPTASATSPCARRCRASPARWSTGGSTGIRDDSLRYRIWHPRGARGEHASSGPDVAGAKRHWGTIHHPVEDVGTRHACARGSRSSRRRGIGFAPTRSTTRAWRRSSCGYAGDDAPARCGTR